MDERKSRWWEEENPRADDSPAQQHEDALNRRLKLKNAATQLEILERKLRGTNDGKHHPANQHPSDAPAKGQSSNNSSNSAGQA